MNNETEVNMTITPTETHEKVIVLSPKNQETFKNLFQQKILIQQQIDFAVNVLLDTLEIESEGTQFKFSKDWTQMILNTQNTPQP